MTTRSPASSPSGSPAGSIGVFDSGVGGLTVAAALERRLPDWPIVYLGDTARLPYGTKSDVTVRRYTERNVAFLAARGVSLVVVACNSASALALEPHGAATPGFSSSKVPVLGVIEPGAQRAAAVAKTSVGVVATEATINSGAYQRALRALRSDLAVHATACPLLVPLVEEGWFDDDVTHTVVRRYLEPLLAQDIDTLILGCTHYPLLRPVFARWAPGVTLVDSADATSERAAEVLDSSELQPPFVDKRHDSTRALTAFVTDSSPRFARIARSILERDVDLQWIDTP